MSDRNCLSYWFPKLQAAGLPVPRTEIVSTNVDLTPMLDNETPVNFDAFLFELTAAAKRIGPPPWFLRTGQGSGKHHWRDCCYVRYPGELEGHVAALVEWSHTVDFFGLAHDVWAVREFLPTKPIGVCENYFGMPVCREFRFFASSGDHDSGIVQCWHPYWPLDALNQGGFAADVPQGWYEKFSTMTTQEAIELHALARAAAQVCGGAWSVDILGTERGWFITDMAEAKRSFHWPDCPRSGAKPAEVPAAEELLET